MPKQTCKTELHYALTGFAHFNSALLHIYVIGMYE